MITSFSQSCPTVPFYFLEGYRCAGSCLFKDQLTSMLQYVKIPSVRLQLGLTVVSNLAATAEGAALLLKSPLLPKSEQQLHYSLQRREGPRTSALLGPLINLAVRGEGQKQILRAASAPGQIRHLLACSATFHPTETAPAADAEALSSLQAYLAGLCDVLHVRNSPQ